MRSLLVALVGGFLAAWVPACGGELAKNRDFRQMRFVVEAARSVYGPPGSALDAFVPIGDVVICPPPIANMHGLPGKDWLVEHGLFIERQDHKFGLRDGSLAPRATIALAGDSICLIADGTTPLAVSSEIAYVRKFADADGQPCVRLLQPSPTAVPCDVLGIAKVGKSPAYIVVSDHGFGAITDDVGMAVFHEWPKDSDMVAAVHCPFINRSFMMESDTLRFVGRRMFIVPRGDDGATHTIRLVAGEVPASVNSGLPQ